LDDVLLDDVLFEGMLFDDMDLSGRASDPARWPALPHT
jgi:hypothetical protein